jgi:hypothetical protein
LKACATEVSDDLVIAQAIKSLWDGTLHSPLVREKPKIVAELYENFAKFSKLEVLHFRKLEQQRKTPKHDEASRPTHYNDNRQHSYPKHVNNIDSGSCGPPQNWEKNFGSPPQERSERTLTIEQTSTTKKGGGHAKSRLRS